MRATQTVFGEGSKSARIILIGEQPGDQEDLAGHPFVGPAGRLLDDSLAAAQIERKDVYITNAVKHFYWQPRGTQRLHKKPPARAVSACRPWLDAEVELIEPAVVICLGATAAQAVIGRDARVSKDRGKFMVSRYCDQTLMTWHPSAVLRAPDDDSRRRMRAELVHDFETAGKAL